jgi:hypothetical protein
VSRLKPGKGMMKYFRIDGLQLFHEEPGEDVEVQVRLPVQPDTYLIQIAAYSDEGDCGVHRLPVTVV